MPASAEPKTLRRAEAPTLATRPDRDHLLIIKALLIAPAALSNAHSGVSRRRSQVIGTALLAWGAPFARAKEVGKGSHLVNIDTPGIWMSMRSRKCRAPSQASKILR